MKTAYPLAFFLAIRCASASAAPDIVPLEFVGGIPFVKVTVGAAPAGRMMFDSGGMIGIAVPQSTIEQSGSVKVLDEKRRFSDLLGQVQEVPMLVARDVVLGATHLPPVSGQINTEWGGNGADADLDAARKGGVIGLEAFAERPLMFDYRRRTMSIYAAGDAHKQEWKKWRALPLSYGKEGPFVTLRVAGVPKKFVLDTGAQVNLVDSGKFACSAECPRPRLPELADAHGKALSVQDAERIDLANAPFDGILGAPFFRSYRVVFDVKGGQLHIAPH
ncbi:MAG: hypothetical protein K0R43_994 [Pseudoduganella sp.]|jgi:hypothetical protein|nr:hypothetical protein [Pseudoduganella sp.]